MSPRRLPDRHRHAVITIPTGIPGGMGDFMRFMSDEFPDRGDQAPGRIVRSRADDFPRPCSIDPPVPSGDAALRIAG